MKKQYNPFGFLRLLPILLLALLTLHLSTAQAQVTGVSYTLSPTAETTDWSARTGLTDGYLYGGKLGLGFGEFIELSGLYLVSQDVIRNTQGLFEGDSLLSQRAASLDAATLPVDLTRYGAELRFNLTRSSIIPFLTLGSGIIRFEPEGLDQSENVYLTLGGGLTFSLADRYTLSLQTQNLRYNFNPGTALLTGDALQTLGVNAADLETDGVNSWTYRASLGIYLGGRRPGDLSELDRQVLEQFSDGFGGLSWNLEPFYGRLNFAKALGFRRDQEMVGVNAGFNFGPQVGVRGFYWRALEPDGFVTDFDDLSMYGGELKLDLNAGSGLLPHLTLGGGYLDVKDTYVGELDEAGFPLADSLDSRAFASVGAGVVVPLSRNFRLHASARRIFMGANGLDSDNLTNPDEVLGSWMYSVGTNFVIGRSARQPNIVRQETMEEEMARQRLEIETERDQLLAEAQSSETAQLAEALNRMAERVEAVIARLETAEETRAAGADAGTPVKQAGEMTVPIVVVTPPAPILPGTGYGTGTGSNMAETELLVRTTVERAVGQLDLTDNTQMLKDMEARFDARFAALEERLVKALSVQAQGETNVEAQRQLRELQMEQQLRRSFQEEIDQLREELRRVRTEPRQGAELYPATPTQHQMQGPAAQPGATRTTLGSQMGLRLASIHPMVGANVNGGPTQLILGVRATYFSNLMSGRLRVVPEATVGLLDAVSYNINLHGIYPFGPRISKAQPYIGAGFGLLGFTAEEENILEGVLNIVLGADFNVGEGAFFAEFQGLDLLSFNRVMAGYRYALN